MGYSVKLDVDYDERCCIVELLANCPERVDKCYCSPGLTCGACKQWESRFDLRRSENVGVEKIQASIERAELQIDRLMAVGNKSFEERRKLKNQKLYLKNLQKRLENRLGLLVDDKETI